MSGNQQENIVKLHHRSGASVDIYLYGATVTSWKTPEGKERLYLSKKSVLDGSAPIRGGIPICFPIFGGPPAAEEAGRDESLIPHSHLEGTHGFARSAFWTLVEARDDQATFALAEPFVPRDFPRLRLEYKVNLGEKSLETSLRVHLPKSETTPFKFKVAFHTYYAVDDTSATSLEGFSQGVSVKDNLKGVEEPWKGDVVKAEQETAKLFSGHTGDLLINSPSSSINIQTPGFDDWMIWNPAQKAGTSVWSDMEIGDGSKFICAEPGCLREWKILQPGDEWVGSQIVTAQ